MFLKYFPRGETLVPACTVPILKIANEVSARTIVARTMHVTANVEKYYSNLYGRMEKINK
jgi:hypothetical protein